MAKQYDVQSLSIRRFEPGSVEQQHGCDFALGIDGREYVITTEQADALLRGLLRHSSTAITQTPADQSDWHTRLGEAIGVSAEDVRRRAARH